MFQRYFISILIVAAILNPLCCCTSKLSSDQLSGPSFTDWEEISKVEDSVPREVPCQSLDSCPIQLVANKIIVFQLPEIGSLPLNLFSLLSIRATMEQWVIPLKEDKPAFRRSSFFEIRVSQRIRPHQEHCVYLN